MIRRARPRIGPRMKAVLEHVRANPGCTKKSAAEVVGPRGSLRFGYRTVNRTIAADLICALQSRRGGAYALYPVEVLS